MTRCESVAVSLAPVTEQIFFVRSSSETLPNVSRLIRVEWRTYDYIRNERTRRAGLSWSTGISFRYEVPPVFNLWAPGPLIVLTEASQTKSILHLIRNLQLSPSLAPSKRSARARRAAGTGKVCVNFNCARGKHSRRLRRHTPAFPKV